MSDVRLRDVTVRLGGRTIVEHVSLEVAAGEWVGLIGPNGAGKTTLLRTVAGTGPVAEGGVEVDGVDLGRRSRRERAKLVAMVPQRPLIPAEVTVTDYVLLGRTPHLGPLAIEGAADLRAVSDAIDRLDLTELADRKLGTLSGGELQRVVLARAVAQDSPILLLDEPTAALDLGHQQDVMELVEELRRRRGLTVIAALHDLTLAAQFCDRLVMLAGGRVVGAGEARAVLDETAILRHYGARVRVMDDGAGGILVIPVRGRAESPAPAGLAGDR